MGLGQLLFSGMGNLRVDRAWLEGGVLHLSARATGKRARCPCCGCRSRRRHSQYQRTIADLACGGRRVIIHLQARRFWCLVRGCAQKVFCERLPDLAAAWARRSRRLRDRLRDLAFRLGGEAGSRQAAADGTPVSARALLRLLRATLAPSAGAVRVLGIDDWARRKGHTYGTILVDLERHCVIDVLADRTAGTVATWLQGHPELEIISRDRGGAYAEGARHGAPQATQIADRWHLLCNLGDALERLLVREYDSVRRVADAVAQGPELVDGDPAIPLGEMAPGEPPPASPSAAPVAVAPALTATERERLASRQRRLARYDEVIALQAQGLGIATIAKRLGMARKTVRRFLRAGGFPERVERTGQSGRLAAFDAYLLRRWDEGCQNASQLFREIKAQGYPGSASYVGQVLGAWRTAAAPTGRRRAGVVLPQGTQLRIPPRRRRTDRTPRQVRFLLLRPVAGLNEVDQTYRAALLAACPVVESAQRLVTEFQRVIETHDLAALAPWLTAAQQSDIPELQGFALGIRQDRAAVEAGITEPWSQGQTEGQVNRLKGIKRTMYGRANFDLLRLRVLHRVPTGR